MKNKCGGCGKDIAMKIEFGGCYYSFDGDTYCDKNCHDKLIKRISILDNEKDIIKYLIKDNK